MKSPKDGYRDVIDRLQEEQQILRHESKQPAPKKPERFRTAYQTFRQERALARPDRYHADYAVKRAIKAGNLTKPAVCAASDDACKGRIEAHHWHGYDPEHWLDVQWLCAHHHNLAELDANKSAFAEWLSLHPSMTAIANDAGKQI